MRERKHSQAFLRKRKMLLVMPLLVLPFITIVFSVMGGGKGVKPSAGVSINRGLNLDLPDAALKEDKQQDKLSFYDKALKDSAKMAEWMRNDPYYQRAVQEEESSTAELEDLSKQASGKYGQLKTSPYQGTSSNLEQKMIRKLAQLEKEINNPVGSQTPKDTEGGNWLPAMNNQELNTGVDRLEAMLQAMQDRQAEDPEMKQLDGTLDKILDIQHPQRVKDRLGNTGDKKAQVTFPVSKMNKSATFSVMGNPERVDTARDRNRFYGSENDEELTGGTGQGIRAVIHETKTLVNGSVVKLRLLDDVAIKDEQVPRDHFVFGYASLRGERLEILIPSIRCGQRVFPVKLEVFDLDGLPGIYIPGAITRDALKQSTDQALPADLPVLDPSLQAQVAAAGVSTLKTVLSRKIKLVKVVVKADYQVILVSKDNYN